MDTQGQPAEDAQAPSLDDQHQPFLYAVSRTRAGEPFPVALRVGQESEHPDLEDHHIDWVQLWSGERLLAEARFAPGLLGGSGCTGHPTVTFTLVPAAGSLELRGVAHCTLHGTREGEPLGVEVEDPES